MLMDKRQKNILFYCTLFLVILTITCSFVCHSMANINLEMKNNNNIVDSSLVATDTAVCNNTLNDFNKQRRLCYTVNKEIRI